MKKNILLAFLCLGLTVSTFSCVQAMRDDVLEENDVTGKKRKRTPENNQRDGYLEQSETPDLKKRKSDDGLKAVKQLNEAVNRAMAGKNIKPISCLLENKSFIDCLTIENKNLYDLLSEALKIRKSHPEIFGYLQKKCDSLLGRYHEMYDKKKKISYFEDMLINPRYKIQRQWVKSQIAQENKVLVELEKETVFVKEPKEVCCSICRNPQSDSNPLLDICSNGHLLHEECLSEHLNGYTYNQEVPTDFGLRTLFTRGTEPCCPECRGKIKENLVANQRIVSPTDLPINLRDMSDLRTLDLMNNQQIEISTTDLPNTLESLNLGFFGNLPLTLPASIRNLPNLQNLDLNE